MWQRLKMVFVDLKMNSGVMAGRVGSIGSTTASPTCGELPEERRGGGEPLCIKH